MSQGPAPGRECDDGTVKEEPGRSDAKHGGRDRLMRRRTCVERKVSVEDQLEMMVHDWKCHQCVISQEMMIHEQ